MHSEKCRVAVNILLGFFNFHIDTVSDEYTIKGEDSYFHTLKFCYRSLQKILHCYSIDVKIEEPLISRAVITEYGPKMCIWNFSFHLLHLYFREEQM